MPALEKGNGDEDDNRLASMANLDLRILVSAYCLLPSAHRLFRCIAYMGVVCAMSSRLESASCGVVLSYLASRDELERAQRALQVGDIVLEISQGLETVSMVSRAGRH